MKKPLSSFIIVLFVLLISCSKENNDLGNNDKTFSQDLCGYYYNPPTIVNNALFIGTSHKLFEAPRNANFMFKLDADLNKVWEYALGTKEVRGSAALDSQGNIYFVVQENRAANDMSNSELYLYSITGDGLSLRWKQKVMGVGDVPDIGMLTPAISVDNKIYVGGDKLYAFDSDGNLQWEYPAAGSSKMNCMNAPIIDDNGNIYFGNLSSVVSLAPDGTERWSKEDWNESSGSCAFSYDYSKVYAPRGLSIHCFETATGNEIWNYTPQGAQGGFRATPAIDDLGNVYIGTKANEKSVLYAIKSDGTGLLWSNPMGADLYCSPALGNNRVLYIGSEYIDGKRFHAIDMATGDIIWSKQLASDITWSSPAISASGVVYVGCMPGEDEKGYVFGFPTDAGGLLHNAGSPRFHGSNANNGRR